MYEDIEESARLILEHNRDTNLFWAVLTFTCTVGIIELLPIINKSFPSWEQICLGIIYFVLLIGIVFSVWRVFEIYRENRELLLSGRIGERIRKKAEENRTFMDKFVDWPWNKPAEILCILLAAIVFALLYAARIGVL